MPLLIVRQDITKMDVDAIVNATDVQCSGSGGLDAQIHRAAGVSLKKAVEKCGDLTVGQCVITKAYALPCRYVVHTVGPVWRGGDRGEREQLASCYQTALTLAFKKRCESIAFPLISTGTFGYPKAAGLWVAMETVRAFLQDHDMTVYLVLFGKESFEVGSAHFDGIRQYIDDRYAEQVYERSVSICRRDDTVFEAAPCVSAPQASYPCAPAPKASSLEEFLKMRDESFSQMLLRKIDESGMTDVQCYKKANVDRKLFSKIRSNVHYKPGKPTVIAFAVALELSLDETKELLSKAGLALSHSENFDLIVEYYITRRVYDIYEINAALFAYDQCLLGV